MATSAKIYNIYYDAKPGVVMMEWNGYATSAQFREGTELMLNTLIQNKCAKVLADIRYMDIIGSDDQKWLENDFLPRAMRFGFRSIAIITPHSYFNKIAVESVSYKIDKEKMTVNFFERPEEALEWLK